MNDGCVYDVVILPNFHYYFMDSKMAEEFLWGYYKCSQWEKDSEEVREYNKYTLSTVGNINGIGSIYERYFEDFGFEGFE